MKNMLKGKKTYIIAGLMVAKNVVELVSGDITLNQFINSPDIEMILMACGFMTMRSGIEKNK